jgi:hypothetical protein
VTGAEEPADHGRCIENPVLEEAWSHRTSCNSFRLSSDVVHYMDDYHTGQDFQPELVATEHKKTTTIGSSTDYFEGASSGGLRRRCSILNLGCEIGMAKEAVA